MSAGVEQTPLSLALPEKDIAAQDSRAPTGISPASSAVRPRERRRAK